MKINNTTIQTLFFKQSTTETIWGHIIILFYVVVVVVVMVILIGVVVFKVSVLCMHDGHHGLPYEIFKTGFLWLPLLSCLGTDLSFVFWLLLPVADSYPRVSQQALNRWSVAYTLINNPDLLQDTATKLALRKMLLKEGKRLLKEGVSSNPTHPSSALSAEAGAKKAWDSEDVQEMPDPDFTTSMDMHDNGGAENSGHDCTCGSLGVGPEEAPPTYVT